MRDSRDGNGFINFDVGEPGYGSTTIISNSAPPVTPQFKWKFILNGNTLVISTFTAPNAFHRAMQKLFFGFEWESLE